MTGDTRHQLLADTSTLVAVGNADCWDVLAESLAITTTNVCKHELGNHVERNQHAPDGSRERYLHRGSRRVLEQLDAESSTWSTVTVVPRPHGADAGEESLKRELDQHADSYQVVALLDGAARRSIRRLIDDRGYDVDVVGPPYLLYVLLENDRITRVEFCEATGEMIRTEGWTGYEVVKSAWASIPVDCGDVLEDDVLPPE